MATFQKLNKRWRLHYILLGIIIVFSGYLLLKNLGGESLWDDEAQTAIIAKNFLKTGHFTGWDGRNLYADRNGALLSSDLKVINPPLQYLVAAASMSIFGKTTAGARMLFAIIGLFTVLLLYQYIRKEFPQYPVMALYGTGFLGIFTEYLLYARNCRYYALVSFLSLLTLYMYLCLIKHLSARTMAGFVTAIILLYMAHFQICFAFVISLCCVYFIFEPRRELLKNWKLVLAGILAVFLVLFPYTIIFHIWERPDMEMHNGFLHRVLPLLLLFLRDSLLHGIAPWMVVISTILLLKFGKLEAAKKSFMIQILSLILIHIVLVAITTKQDSTEFNFAQIRYLSACFPLLALLIAVICNYLHTKNIYVAFAVFVFAATTSGTYMFYWPGSVTIKVTPLLYKYIHEIQYPNTTAISAVSDYLRKNAQQNETYSTLPGYMNYPVSFYVGDKVYISCELDSSTHLDLNKIKLLCPKIVVGTTTPDWIILFGNTNKDLQKRIALFTRGIVDSNGDTNYAEYEAAQMIPVFWSQINRPEIMFHFFTPPDLSNDGQKVLVLHKVANSKDDKIWLDHFQAAINLTSLFADTTLALRINGRFFRLFCDNPKMVLARYSGPLILNNLKAYERTLFDCKQFAVAAMVGNTIVEREPDSASNYYNLAKIYLELQRYDMVVVLCDKFLKQLKNTGPVYLLKATALEQQGKMKQVVSVLQQGYTAVDDLNDKGILQYNLMIAEQKAGSNFVESTGGQIKSSKTSREE